MEKNKSKTTTKHCDKNEKKERAEKTKSEKIAKKTKSKKKRVTSKSGNKKGQKGFFWFLGISAMSVALLLGCQFFFENTITGKERFYNNTRINGIDVGGMSVAEAENVVLTDMLNSKKEIEIEFVSKDKSWLLNGSDFEVSNKIQPIV